MNSYKGMSTTATKLAKYISHSART